jgi:hypothetical protein
MTRQNHLVCQTKIFNNQNNNNIMKNQEIQKIEPKIRIIIHSKAGNVRLRPSIKKARKMLKTTLRNHCKLGDFVTLRVIYGIALNSKGKKEVIDNTMKTNSIDDLAWTLSAFLDKDLWLDKVEQ